MKLFLKENPGIASYDSDLLWFPVIQPKADKAFYFFESQSFSFENPKLSAETCSWDIAYVYHLFLLCVCNIKPNKSNYFIQKTYKPGTLTICFSFTSYSGFFWTVPCLKLTESLLSARIRAYLLLTNKGYNWCQRASFLLFPKGIQQKWEIHEGRGSSCYISCSQTLAKFKVTLGIDIKPSKVSCKEWNSK